MLVEGDDPLYAMKYETGSAWYFMDKYYKLNGRFKGGKLPEPEASRLMNHWGSPNTTDAIVAGDLKLEDLYRNILRRINDQELEDGFTGATKEEVDDIILCYAA